MEKNGKAGEPVIDAALVERRLRCFKQRWLNASGARRTGYAKLIALWRQAQQALAAGRPVTRDILGADVWEIERRLAAKASDGAGARALTARTRAEPVADVRRLVRKAGEGGC